MNFISSLNTNCNIYNFQAAGLGHGGILRYITDRYPQGINDVDSDGRTPLHYAATVKDEQHTFNMLVSLGADESAVDNVSNLQHKAEHDFDDITLSTVTFKYFFGSIIKTWSLIATNPMNPIKTGSLCS